MTLQVELAFIGNPRIGLHEGYDDEYQRLHYVDLPRVRVETDEAEYLRTVVLQGCRIASMPGADQYMNSWKGVAFRNASYELGRSAEVYFPTVLDSMGRARWNADKNEISMGELLAAEQAGVLEGEALRPCISLDSGYGNGAPVDWSDYLLALAVLWEMMKGIDTLHGFTEGMRATATAVSRRLRRGQEVTARTHPDWKSRGGLPPDVQALVRRHAWDGVALAALLGVDHDGAEGVLWSYGFEYDEGLQLWRPPGGDDVGALLQIIHAHAAAYDAGYEAGQVEMMQQVMALLEEHARSGRVQRPPWFL